jgi:uncharacterized caspase-like protein
MGVLASLFALTAQPAHAQPTDRNLLVTRAAPQGTGTPAASRQRVALVIGNNAYKDAPLTNPLNDARAMAQALRDAGFQVILRTDSDKRGMLDALREFGDRLRQGGTGLFYFAGHGMQIKGRNFLIPVGADIQREDEVAYAGVDAQAVLDKMEAAGNANNIMILDACRNNPFARSFRSAQQGLAQMDAPVGTLVAFSTAPGSVASDGQGQNGLYTQHLLQAMRAPGLKLEDVFKQTRANVRRDSQGRQIPWEATSLEGDFYFSAAAPAAAPAPAPALDRQAIAEEALWDAVKAARTRTEIALYLDRYPNGRFAAQARDRIAALERPQGAPTPPAPPASVAAASATPCIGSGCPPTPAPIPPAAVAAAPCVGTGCAPAAAPVATAATRVMNANGYAVGDRWRWQVVDKFRGEVVDNWNTQFSRMLPNGDMQSAGGSVWDSLGRNKLTVNAASGARNVTAPYNVAWPSDTLQVGQRFAFENRSEVQPGNGVARTVERKLSGHVVALEKVRVPAGEFEAYRIDYSGGVESKAVDGRTWFETLRQTVWYAPGVKNQVAMEWEVRDARGTLLEQRRVELTSYQLFGDSQMARR